MTDVAYINLLLAISPRKQGMAREKMLIGRVYPLSEFLQVFRDQFVAQSRRGKLVIKL